MDGEHCNIGAPRHAARGVHIGRKCGRRPSDDNTGDRGAVGNPVAGLVGRPGKEVFGHRLAGEHRVSGIDAGVDQTHGLAAARFRPGAVLEFELRIGPVGANRGQPPLVLEVVLAVVAVLDGLAFLLVCLQGNAAEIHGLYAGWLLHLRLGRRRTTPASSATRGGDEAANNKDTEQGLHGHCVICVLLPHRYPGPRTVLSDGSFSARSIPGAKPRSPATQPLHDGGAVR